MHVSKSGSARRPRTQAERRARTRAALLEAGAQAFSRYGYGNVILEKVAAEAGYTRGALYHQFAGKEGLAVAVVTWVAETWEREVWIPAQARRAPVDILVALARGHMVFCRRDVARVMMALRVEFDGREHPVGTKVADIGRDLAKRFGAVVAAGRRDGSIPPGPPAKTLGAAITSAVEGMAIHLAGAPHDELMAERMVRGLLGVNSAG
ncbi:TetR/AcrR family transcriptional regulator [Mycobacterium sp. ITM-2016-00318]|uniref:TetR/AcrR family transcriptional regulator n=1 Tax=Mycobacterium sp. ITM-2016-00318 TaxID=2099693 RepID=UPI000CF9F9AA|nr:TetR/AcrR family transcriptional regulator [Mycobacterium sp. ITM-2016-00318]WNG90814.1 TetR/AcrR family transcriptional regulator [Mycobacterium sp. ITM-2016-00318]